MVSSESLLTENLMFYFLNYLRSHKMEKYKKEPLNVCRTPQSSNSICRMPVRYILCVFVLKSELKIEILEGVSKSFRPIGVGRNVNNL